MSLPPLAPRPATAPAAVPVGAVVAYAGPVDDAAEKRLLGEGWVPCDGRALSAGCFGELYRVLGTRYGSGHGDGTFRVPDYRGLFLRGRQQAGDTPQRDPGRAERTPPAGGNSADAVGSQQDCGLQDHVHRYQEAGRGGTGSVFDPVAEVPRPGFTESPSKPDGTPDSPHLRADETRPVNVYVVFLIKATQRVGCLPLPGRAAPPAPAAGAG